MAKQVKQLLTQGDFLRITGLLREELEGLMEEGLPCYFIGNSFFFDYEATQTWLLKRINLGITESTIEGLKAYIGFLATLKFNMFWKLLKVLKKGNYSNDVFEYCQDKLTVNKRAYIKSCLLKLDPDLKDTDCDRLYLVLLRHLIELRF